MAAGQNDCRFVFLTVIIPTRPLCEPPMQPFFASYLDRLQNQHAELEKAITGLRPEALDWVPREGVNSLTALTIHALGSERWLIVELIGGTSVNRDREAEFHARGLDSETLIARSAENLAAIHATLETLTLADLARAARWRDRDVTADWVLFHCLGHFAGHVGEAQALRHWWENRH
jgi:hypothetical protein